MPVDTREKRASVTNLFTPLPLADGAVAVGDRRQVSWVYAGDLVALSTAPRCARQHVVVRARTQHIAIRDRTQSITVCESVDVTGG